MRDWLTIELVLAVLMATSFTCVGLVALWAATSPRHWFLRTAGMLGILSLLLLVPAYESFLVFAFQAIVVVCGVRLWGWIVGFAGTTAKVQTFARFSLSTLMWLMALTAVVLAIAARTIAQMPPQNLESWTTIVIHGGLGGIAVLVGGWMFASKRKRWAFPAALVLCLLIAAFFAWQDWFVVSVLSIYVGWPPISANWQQSGWDYVGTYSWRVAFVWLGTVLGITWTIYGLLLLWFGVLPRTRAAAEVCLSDRKVYATAHTVASVATVLLILLIVACPAYFLLRLLNPSPIPQVTLPEPNGYDDFVAAGMLIENGSPLLNTAIEPQSTEELAAEVAKFSAAYDRIRLGLARPCQALTWSVGRSRSSDGLTLPIEEIQSLRAAARALLREAELAQQQGRYSDAAAISIENIQLGQTCARGGLTVDYLVGNAIEGIGQSTLYPAIENLDAESCREAIASLDRIDDSREPLAEIFARDRIWDENAYGWHGHLLVVLDDIAGGDRDTHEMIKTGVLPRRQAIHRLLMVELALRRYQLAHDNRPHHLDQLVPEFLAQIPIDPHDASGRGLRYVPSADDYMLYSVGYDGDDDGGRPLPVDEYSGYDEYGDGDVRLDQIFAPDQSSESGVEGVTADEADVPEDSDLP